jgi:hypothetical protein
MQNKNIFIDEGKIFELVNTSKNKINTIEEENNATIKIIYEEFNIKNDELINIFNQKEAIINKQYIVSKQELKDKNATYKKMYTDLVSNYLKETETLSLELKESFNILKTEEVKRFNQVISDIEKDKITELEIINKTLEDTIIKINNQKQSLVIEYEKMIDTNNKNLNQKVSNITSDLNLKLKEVENTFEQNKIKIDTTYSSDIIDINNKYIQNKKLHDTNIEEIKELTIILQKQLDNNLNNLKVKTTEYINNLELSNLIRDLNNNTEMLTTQFNKDNGDIASEIIYNQQLSITNKSLENKLEQQLVLLNDIQNDIINNNNNEQYQIYSNKLDEIESDFIKTSDMLQEENIIISEKEIDSIIANIINTTNINVIKKTNDLSTINSKLKTDKEQCTASIENKKISLEKLQLELLEVSDDIIELNSNIANKTSDELNILLQANKDIALEEATKISADFLNINQVKYKKVKSSLIKDKEENLRILNLEFDSYDQSYENKLIENKESLVIITDKVNEYNSIVENYNRELEELTEQMKEANHAIKLKSDNTYTKSITEQVNKLKNELNLNLDELTSNNSVQKNNYNIEIANLEENNKIIISSIDENTIKLSSEPEYINKITAEFETLVKENNDKQDKDKLEENDRLSSELTTLKTEMDSYVLLITNLTKSKEIYIGQLIANLPDTNTTDLLLKIQDIDNTLDNINTNKTKVHTNIVTNETELANINTKYNNLVNETTLIYLEDLEKKKVQHSLNNEQYTKLIKDLNITLVDNNNKIIELNKSIKQLDVSLAEERISIILSSETLIKNTEDEYNLIRIKTIEDSQQNNLDKFNIDSAKVINNLELAVTSFNIEDETKTISELTTQIDILERKIEDNKLTLKKLADKSLLVENNFNILYEENEVFNNLNINNAKQILEQHYKTLEPSILNKYDINFIKNILSDKNNQINEYNNKIAIINNEVSLLNDKLKDLDIVHNSQTISLKNEIIQLNNKMKLDIDELTNNKDSIIKNNYNSSLSIITNEYTSKKDKLSLEYKDIIDVKNRLVIEKQENNDSIKNITTQLFELQTKNKTEISDAISDVSKKQSQINLDYNTQINNIKLELVRLEKEKEILFNKKIKELQAEEISKFEKEYEFTFNIIDNKDILNKETELLEIKQTDTEVKTKMYNSSISNLTSVYQDDIQKNTKLSNLELSKINDTFNIDKSKHMLEHEENYNSLDNKIDIARSDNILNKSKVEDKYSKIVNNENNINIVQLKELDSNLNNKKQDILSELEKTFHIKINEYYINYDEALVLLNKQNAQLLEDNNVELVNNMNNNKVTLDDNKNNNINLLLSNIEKEKSNALTLMKQLSK